MFKFYVYNIQAQKQAGLHLTSDDNRTKEVQHYILLNNINRVNSGKLCLLHFLLMFLLFFKLHFISTFPFLIGLSIANVKNPFATSSATAEATFLPQEKKNNPSMVFSTSLLVKIQKYFIFQQSIM